METDTGGHITIDGAMRTTNARAFAAGDVTTGPQFVYVAKAGWTVDQLADTWAPYLTMNEGLKLAAQSCTTDITTMTCCA